MLLEVQYHVVNICEKKFQGCIGVLIEEGLYNFEKGMKIYGKNFSEK